MIGFVLIDLLRGTRIVRNYFFYKKIYNSGLSSVDLLRYQKENLILFLLRIKENPFFQNILREYSNDEIVSQPYAILSKLPITDKTTISNNFNLFYNNNYPHEHAYTGGSTGSPFHYVVDKISISKSRAFNYFLWNKYLGYKLGDRIIVIAGSSLGGGKSLKKVMYNFLQSKTYISGGIINENFAKELANQINKSKKGIFLYAYPSSLLHYITILDSKNIKVNISNVRAVICTSEMLYDEQKEYIETFFNKPVLNVYGANDGGIMSASLNNKEFFYNGIDCFVETVDVLGYEELLLTNLTSYAFPFVRYRVGDIGILDSDGICPFVLRDIKGRTRDFVYVSDTEKIHGSAFNKVFKRHSDIVNYQVIQQENTDCVVRIVTTFENKALEDESELIRDLSKLFRTINFKVEYVKEIDRANNGKQKNIISNVI